MPIIQAMKKNNPTLRKTLPLILAGGLLLGLTACGPDNTLPDKTPPSASASPTPDATTSPDPSPSSTEDSTDPATAEPVEPPTVAPDTQGDYGQEGSELKEAKEKFPDAQATESFSKEDVQLALYSTYRYTALAYNDTNFINGTWYSGGMNPEYLNETVQPYMSDDMQAQTVQLASESAAENGMGDATDDLLYFLLFLNFDGENSAFAPADVCSTSILTSCLQDENFKNYQLNFQEIDGKLYIQANFTANILLDRLGEGEDGTPEPGVFSSKYELEFEMMKNPYKDESRGIPSYVFNNVGGAWSSTGWAPLN